MAKNADNIIVAMAMSWRQQAWNRLTDAIPIPSTADYRGDIDRSAKSWWRNPHQGEAPSD